MSKMVQKILVFIIVFALTTTIGMKLMQVTAGEDNNSTYTITQEK